MGRLAVALQVTEAGRAELSGLASRRNTDGTQNKDVAARLALDAATILTRGRRVGSTTCGSWR